MDQIKIGNFIQKKRKDANLTQSELAEKLYVTDRAISKWENGICLPDTGNITELCKILNITINDLFSGEVIDMKNNEKQLEKNLLEMTKLKEENDKQLLLIEIFIGFISSIVFLTVMLLMPYFQNKAIAIILAVVSTIQFLITMFLCLRIEQKAGYYECGKCHHKYIPNFMQTLFAMHINRTRYFKCPKCNRRSWNKKVISK